MQPQGVPYRAYWIIWIALLALTLVMLGVEGASFPRVLVVLVLAGAMLTKAGLIAGWFMHLKFERTALVLSVVLGVLLTAGFLFFLIAPDGVRALKLAP